MKKSVKIMLLRWKIKKNNLKFRLIKFIWRLAHSGLLRLCKTKEQFKKLHELNYLVFMWGRQTILTEIDLYIELNNSAGFI